MENHVELSTRWLDPKLHCTLYGIHIIHHKRTYYTLACITRPYYTVTHQQNSRTVLLKNISIKMFFYQNIFLYIQNRSFNSFMFKFNQESSRINEEFFKGNKKKIKFLLKLEFY